MLSERGPVRVAVLVSGGGTNLQALFDAARAGDLPDARVVLVVADRDTAGGLDRARAAGVDTAVARPGAGLADGLTRVLREHDVELVVLAGYLQLVPAPVVRAWAGRILNIHPALLPDFGGRGWYGLRVHRGVLASGAAESGATVHLVTEEFDEGPIVLQRRVPVLPGDTPEALQERVKTDAEWRILPAAVQQVAHRLRHGDAHGTPTPDSEEEQR